VAAGGEREVREAELGGAVAQAQGFEGDQRGDVGALWKTKTLSPALSRKRERE
jgi:hypothetical protein